MLILKVKCTNIKDILNKGTFSTAKYQFLCLTGQENVTLISLICIQIIITVIVFFLITNIEEFKQLEI